jgi:hypothetical protein
MKLKSEDFPNLPFEIEMLEAFIEVESGGKGFDSKTGKILIQFEPAWFKRKVPYAPSGKWSVNKVDVQSKEWEAFNDAFKIDPNGAMESTSIGLPQIMGFHWKKLGYSSVGTMWDDFKVSETNQIKALVKFIDTDKMLLKAMKEKDWHKIASIYNGSGYKELAERLGREPYDISLRKAYEKRIK